MSAIPLTDETNVTPIKSIDQDQQLRAEGELLIADANALAITDDTSNETAADFAKSINKSIAGVESYFKGLIEPVRAGLQALYDRRKLHLEPRESALQIVKGKLGEYRQLQERAAAEEARKREEAARRVEEEIRGEEFDAAVAAGDEVAAQQIIERPVMVPPPVIAVQKPKGLSFRETWAFEVTSVLDLAKFVIAHPEYANVLSANATAIRQLVNAQKQACALHGHGVRIYSEKQVATSRR
jgi:hypothetical protein